MWRRTVDLIDRIERTYEISPEFGRWWAVGCIWLLTGSALAVSSIVGWYLHGSLTWYFANPQSQNIHGIIRVQSRAFQDAYLLSSIGTVLSTLEVLAFSEWVIPDEEELDILEGGSLP